MNITATTDSLCTSANNNSLKHPSPQSRQSSKWQLAISFLCKEWVLNEYIDSQFLAGSCGSRQRQVADGPMGLM